MDAAVMEGLPDDRWDEIPPNFDDEIVALDEGRNTGSVIAPTTARRSHGLVGLTLEQLEMHTFPARKPLLVRGETAVFREGHLGEVYAERGIGKTWFTKTLALVASSGCEALGFRAPTRCRVLDVDGEMASPEIQDRYALLTERLCIPRTSNLTIVAADWQEEFLPRLDTVEGQAAIEPFVADADLILLDNRSCLFDPEGEKDPGAWQPAQDWLLSLRRRGKGVLVNHHSNRQGGARGHSKPEDPMDILIKLTRPEGYSQEQGASFIITFEKARSAHGADVAPFAAQLTPDGWRTNAADQPDGRHSAIDKLCVYLRLAHDAGERPKSANDAITKARINRKQRWTESLGCTQRPRHVATAPRRRLLCALVVSLVSTGIRYHLIPPVLVFGITTLRWIPIPGTFNADPFRGTHRCPGHPKSRVLNRPVDSWSRVGRHGVPRISARMKTGGRPAGNADTRRNGRARRSGFVRSGRSAA